MLWKLSAAIIEKRLNYWTWLLCPKFSEKDRKAVDLHRDYSINQIEYCRNFIFKRHFPIHKIFEQSCEMGLFRLPADKVAYIFGVRVTKRLRGRETTLRYDLQALSGTPPLPITTPAYGWAPSLPPVKLWRVVSVDRLSGVVSREA